MGVLNAKLSEKRNSANSARCSMWASLNMLEYAPDSRIHVPLHHPIFCLLCTHVKAELSIQLSDRTQFLRATFERRCKYSTIPFTAGSYIFVSKCVQSSNPPTLPNAIDLNLCPRSLLANIGAPYTVSKWIRNIGTMASIVISCIRKTAHHCEKLGR